MDVTILALINAAIEELPHNPWGGQKIITPTKARPTQAKPGESEHLVFQRFIVSYIVAGSLLEMPSLTGQKIS